MKTEYKKAGEEDCKLLGEMNKRLIEDEGHSNKMSVAELTARMEGFLEDRYCAFIMLVDEEIAGYCLYRDDDDYIYIRQIYIERDKRGKGLGKSLLHWLKENVWVDRRVRTEVLVGNDGGRGFWRKVGFSEYCITLEMK